MKLLYLTHRVPFPPNRGDRIRSYHILKFLSARADVDLACLADEPGPRLHVRNSQLIAAVWPSYRYPEPVGGPGRAYRARPIGERGIIRVRHVAANS